VVDQPGWSVHQRKEQNTQDGDNRSHRGHDTQDGRSSRSGRGRCFHGDAPRTDTATMISRAYYLRPGATDLARGPILSLLSSSRTLAVCHEHNSSAKDQLMALGIVDSLRCADGLWTRMQAPASSSRLDRQPSAGRATLPRRSRLADLGDHHGDKVITALLL
jgi:hypothetical protein